MALGHWHGYLWTGSSKDLKDESLRRPGVPGGSWSRPWPEPPPGSALVSMAPGGPARAETP